MTGEVGFILTEPSYVFAGEEMYIEKLKPMLYATLECNVYDPFICFQFLRLVHRFGFKVNGVKLEKFESPNTDTFQYMIPLLVEENP
ncbi:hypothetical protein [Bacillus sp. FJAT-27445]|uniref:hypothetical protein n=1 Tax=Bacillus sp. FJAT-27445 TaxID=1679166 RepID=UPI0007433A81|nr:hypothetical protein [Bacillus sp. FJAT-27445]